MTPPPACPLCDLDSAQDHYADAAARYFRCPRCTLVFRHPAERPAPAEERARYEKHRNDASDPGYTGFLRQLADPVIERLAPGARGLDFGCGPTPVLAAMLTSAGFPCAAYDPLFAPDTTLLGQPYDFITCTEVVEHLRAPREAFALLARMLSPGGILGVMTRFCADDVSFGDWWYRRDATHVCFYSDATMRWIAARQGWSVEFPRANIALFTAPRSA